jgi:hypothetical protein
MDLQNILSELKAEFSRISHAIAALEGTLLVRTSPWPAAQVENRRSRSQQETTYDERGGS